MSAKSKKKTEPVIAPAGPKVERRARYDIWPIGKIKPYELNARVHSQLQIDKLRASYREKGELDPLIVDENGVLLAGHGRLKALQQEQYEVVQVLVALGWTDVEKMAFRIAHNQLGLASEWDKKLLKGQVIELHAMGVNIEQLGFDAPTAAQLSFDAKVGLTDPDENAPEAPKDADVTSLRGDVWLLGRHRLTCGDCTNPDDVARVLNGGRPHLMVTDPPYGVEYDPEWRDEADGGERRAIGRVLNDDRADWAEAWALFPGDVAYIWHSSLRAHEVANSLINSKFSIRAHIVWVKSRPTTGRGNYKYQHEPAFYTVREGADDCWHHKSEPVLRFDDFHEVGTYAVSNKPRATAHWRKDELKDKQSTVWEIEHRKSETGHGTQKPIECMKRPIENNSVPGDSVYEPFSGSGTTLIACEMTGRKCYAIELFRPYVDMDVLRWQAFTGKEAILEADGRSFEQVKAARFVERQRLAELACLAEIEAATASVQSDAVMPADASASA